MGNTQPPGVIPPQPPAPQPQLPPPRSAPARNNRSLVWVVVIAIVVALALVGVLTYWVVSQQLGAAGADVTTSNLDSGPGLGHTALRPVPVGGPDVAVGTANTEVGATALAGPGTGSAALGGSA